MRLSLKVSGMTCANCARSIEVGLKRLKGVQEVRVSLEAGRVWVEFVEDYTDPQQIKAYIESLGYRVEEVKKRDRSLQVLVLCWLLSLGLMALMFWHIPLSAELQALLAVVVQGVGGYSFYRGALSALRTRVGNMDLLVAIGSTSALLYSFLSLLGLLPGEPFFETSAFLVTFVRTGKFLEEWVRARALKSLRELLSLQTLKARVLKEGREEEKSLQEVFVGDILLLRTGDIVPIDCVLLEGTLEVEESLLTGESTPVRKTQGERLLSGSSVVSGFGRARVEKTFLGSYANLLAKMVEERLSKKSRLQRLTDRFSHYFVQVVVLLSGIVFLVWYLKTGEVRTALNFALSVLVVSCPCAFGIAVPLALTVGFLRAQRRGVLIKDSSVVEKSMQVLLLDKTGTLTEGRPRLVDYTLQEEGALKLACAMARVSNHPYSVALREFCTQKGVKADVLGDCIERPGVGVLCGEYLLGRSELAQVALYRKGQKLAEFFFKDSLREEAREVVNFLKSRGVRLLMLTGDREDRARAVAMELGIEEFLAEAKPEDKLKKVRELRAKGFCVGVVGDGINDAPAMAEADISFAVSSGADMAKKAGDVVLLGGIGALKAFFEERDRTLRRIKENLFWAFLYNTLAIPVAGGLLYSEGIYLRPELAGLMMALSSLSVVLNSVRK